MSDPLWWDSDSLEDSLELRSLGGAPAPPKDLNSEWDVVIVGGGYTGLWTAYHLLRLDPSRSVVVLEAEHIGFGASGRNGGWVSALWPVSPERIASRHGRDAALNQLAALRETVDEVGAFCQSSAPAAGFVKGGTIAVARTPAQEARAKAYAEHGAAWRDGTVWLDAEQTRERFAAPGARGATFNPNCARVHPRALVKALANRVRAAGASVIEGTPVASIAPGAVTLADGRTIHSPTVIRATEAWSSRLAKAARPVVPVYSLMVATEPLPASTWERIGLAEREVFSDHGHVIIYGQRTVDDRIAFGGRGAPYHWGSRIAPAFDHEESVFAALRSTLRSLIGGLDDVRFTHAWGGPLGIARDWHPSVTFDRDTGLGTAGGYVGDGVAASHLAGRTLAELILGRETSRTALPWVGHRSPRWEPEPLRWLGVNAGLLMAKAADREEERRGRPARTAYLLDRLTGG